MTQERLDAIDAHVAGFEWVGEDASFYPVFTRDVPDLIAEVRSLQARIAQVKVWRDEQGAAESWGCGRDVATVLQMFDLVLD